MNATLPAGGGEAFDNRQPSLAVTKVMRRSGSRPEAPGAIAGGMLGFVYDFAGDFAPGGGWTAQGQKLRIWDTENRDLFELIGATYGGDGDTTFALPNLGGAAAIGTGWARSGMGYECGTAIGASTVTLTKDQMPVHDHALPGGGATEKTRGWEQPFSNLQRSLPLRILINTAGLYPTPGGGGGGGAFLGQLATFAGNSVPEDCWTEADGRLLKIAHYQALFSILGTFYGGDGKETFALPDLRGRAIVGACSDHPLGSAFGTEVIRLTTAQLAAHDHVLPPGGGVTGIAGGGQPMSNCQPSLALNYLVATRGNYPSRFEDGGYAFDEPTLGEIAAFAGNFAPGDWEFAHGQLLKIAENQALFSIFGTRYGGDGKTTFALPDLRGRVAVGTGRGQGDAVDYRPGDRFGTEMITLTVAHLPAHDHGLPRS